MRMVRIQPRWTAGVLIAFGTMILGGCVLLKPMIQRSDHLALRDSETGILAGAEPRDLGPSDAPCAILFVHGFVGAGNNFGELPDRLAADGHFVRVMRLPGHGTSPLDLVPIAADDLLTAVGDEVRSLKKTHSRVILVGHSMGATLATLITAQEGADGLVLAAPYFGVTSRWYYGLSSETWIRLTRPALPWVYKGRLFVQVNRKEAKRDIVSYRWIPREAGDTLLDLGDRVNKDEVLAAVTCPVLLLHAPGDIAASPAAAEAAFKKMTSTDKRFVWLNRSNHHIFWDYDRETVFEAARTFVAKVSAFEGCIPASPSARL
ncbi:MAG: alpha/beta fold hydrolase [Candidatus Hydrogenedentes bacterium]|nr:alpha/beta fold hydrolase [Candidatus Hydrogenedentota bacterium]